MTTVEHIERQITASAEALRQENSVWYRINDTNNLGGRHDAGILHILQKGIAILDIPEDMTQIVMSLHAIEAMMKGTIEAQAGNEEVLFPELEFQSATQIETVGSRTPSTQEIARSRVIAHAAEISLDVKVDPTIYVILHGQTDSRKIDGKSIVEQYYQVLIERYLFLLQTWPVNTMIVQARGADQPPKNQIAVTRTETKIDPQTSPYRIVPAAKLHSLVWQRQNVPVQAVQEGNHATL
jgi:hypothetical protein